MKNILKTILMIMVLAVFLAAGSTQAGWFDKPEKKDKTQSKAHRYDFYPTMGYHMGTLRRDTFSGWKLNETPLHFIKGAGLTADGSAEATLQEGEQVLVMGPKVGDTIVAWRVRIMAPDWNVTRDRSGDEQIVWSTSDPTVGEGPTTE